MVELDINNLKETAIKKFNEIRQNNQADFDYSYDFYDDVIHIDDDIGEIGQITNFNIKFNDPRSVDDIDLKIAVKYFKLITTVRMLKDVFWDKQTENKLGTDVIVGIPNSTLIRKQLTDIFTEKRKTEMPFTAEYPLDLRLRRVGYTTALYDVFYDLQTFFNIRIVEPNYTQASIYNKQFRYSENNGPFIPVDKVNLITVRPTLLLIDTGVPNDVEFSSQFSVIKRVNPKQI